MPSSRLVAVTVASTVLTLLAACGSSSGSSSSSASSSSAPAQAQSVPAPAMPLTIAPTTLATTLNGNTVTLQLSATANTGTATFNGQVAETGNLSLTVLENGSPLVTEIATAYYLTNPYSPLGLGITVNGVSEVVTYPSTTPLPANLTVGSSGPLTTGTYYAANGTTVIGSLTETYSVTANNATSVKYTVYGTGTVNGSPVSETDIYTVSTSGTIALVEVDLLVNGQTLKFT